MHGPVPLRAKLMVLDRRLFPGAENRPGRHKIGKIPAKGNPESVDIRTNEPE
jgi:hypothetical protein